MIIYVAGPRLEPCITLASRPTSANEDVYFLFIYFTDELVTVRVQSVKISNSAVHFVRRRKLSHSVHDGCIKHCATSSTFEKSKAIT